MTNDDVDMWSKIMDPVPSSTLTLRHPIDGGENGASNHRQAGTNNNDGSAFSSCCNSILSHGLMDDQRHHFQEQTSLTESCSSPVRFHDPFIKQHVDLEERYRDTWPQFQLDQRCDSFFQSPYCDPGNLHIFSHNRNAPVEDDCQPILLDLSTQFNAIPKIIPWNSPTSANVPNLTSTTEPRPELFTDLSLPEDTKECTLCNEMQRGFFGHDIALKADISASVTVSPEALIIQSPSFLPRLFPFSEPVLSTSSRSSDTSSIDATINYDEQGDLQSPYGDFQAIQSEIPQHILQTLGTEIADPRPQPDHLDIVSANCSTSLEQIPNIPEQCHNIIHAPRPRHVLPDGPMNLEAKISNAVELASKLEGKEMTHRRSIQARKAVLPYRDGHVEEEPCSIPTDERSFQRASISNEDNAISKTQATRYYEHDSPEDSVPSCANFERQDGSLWHDSSPDEDLEGPLERKMTSATNSFLPVGGVRNRDFDKPSSPPAWCASYAERRSLQDSFLVLARRSGMTYRDIRLQGHFREAESTLRGRFRTLTKSKLARVRKPQWHNKDVNLLKQAVHRHAPDSSNFPMMRIPWKKVAEYIVDNGGSYRFGNATCRKQWDKLVKDSEEK